MREIKFRCKNKIGNWCFFTVLHNGNVNEENFDLETLSQFTGLLDKQGVEIYEGDIVGGTLDDGTTGESPVFWGYNCYQPFSYLNCRGNDLEVIGNIYEHEFLLKNN